MSTISRVYRLTYEDWTKFPDDGRLYEIIDGELFVSPPPSIRHQRILKNIFVRLHQFLEETLRGEALFAPLGVRFAEEEILEPDIVVVLTENLHRIGAQAIEGPPELVVEILSPGTASRDVGKKRSVYERRGVREYWIVDPEAETIEVLVLEGESYRTLGSFGKEERLRSRVLDSISLPVAEVFPHRD